MTFWIIKFKDVFYQFNSPPDLDDFPYYTNIQKELTEEDIYIEDALNVHCVDFYYTSSCPDFLDLGDLTERDLRKIALVKVSSDDIVQDHLETDLKSLSPEDSQELYEEICKTLNRPYVSNKSELTPEEIRKFLVTNSTDILSKLADGGLYPLKCLFEALDSKDIYSILGSSCTLYSDIKYNILKDMPIQDLAQFIGNFEQKNIEDLSKYLPASVVDTISEQQIKSISSLIDIVKKLTPYEIGSVVSMLPMDKIELFKKAVDAKIKCNPSNVKGKTSLVDKLKNNKLI